MAFQRRNDGTSGPPAKPSVEVLLVKCTALLATFVSVLLFCYNSIGLQEGSRVGDCDPGLKQPEGSIANAYAQRKDRCEGIYAREIAGTSLGVASFTKQFPNFDLKMNDTIRLDWSSPTNSTVHLRAVVLKPRFFYRMDALRREGTTSWEWPTDVLSTLGIEKTNLGVVATTTVSLNGIERELYLPLRISSKENLPSNPYEILLRSDVELSEVFVSITELDKQGKPIRYLRRDEPLQYGVYPAERGIPVLINSSDLHQNAIYEVNVGVRVRTGGSANNRFWIYSGS